MKKPFLLVFLVLVLTSSYAQSARKLLLEGDFHMGMENYEEAEKFYESSTDKKPTFKSFFNTGVAEDAQISDGTSMTAEQAMQQAMQQQAPEEDPKEQEAIASYASAAQLASTPQEKSAAYYNMANTILKNKQTITIEKLEKAIESYKDAIRSNPKNNEARHNLAITQIQLDQAKQQQQQQQQQENQEQQEQENQEQEQQEQEQQENQDKEEEEKDQQQQEQEEQDQKEQEEQEKKEQEQKEKASKAEMEKILEMVDKEDKEVQKKLMMKQQSQTKQKKKKW
jgi:tetratricopeptide (TPR) repeat protein